MLVLAVATLVASAKLHMGQPMHCMSPAEFSGAFSAFFLSFCYESFDWLKPSHDFILVSPTKG